VAIKFNIRKHTVNRSFGGDIPINLFLIFFGLFMIIPVVYAVSTSLKPLDELWTFPPQFIVSHPTLKNFTNLFRFMSYSWIPFSRYIFNTVFISVAGTFGNVILSSMCAFVFSKYKFPGSRFMFSLVVLSLMFNATVTMIPNFIIMSKIGWVDTYYSIIIPSLAFPLGLYLMKQFMEQMIPDSIIESAAIDGANVWVTFWKIAMPMVKPAWLTLIIFSFQTLWNLGSNIYIQSEQLKTFNYALSQILAGGVARAGIAAAATVVMMIVPILLFLFTQGSIVETMSASGMKE